MTSLMKETCKSCGGTGQISYFQGVSRFLLTTEECPECAGLGRCLSTVEKMAEVDEKDKGGERSCDDLFEKS